MNRKLAGLQEELDKLKETSPYAHDREYFRVVDKYGFDSPEYDEAKKKWKRTEEARILTGMDEEQADWEADEQGVCHEA
jgi:hypothetical protein